MESGAGVMVSESDLFVVSAVGVVASVSVTWTVNGPEAVGVPLMTPVAGAMVRPAGKPVADQV